MSVSVRGFTKCSLGARSGLANTAGWSQQRALTQVLPRLQSRGLDKGFGEEASTFGQGMLAGRP